MPGREVLGLLAVADDVDGFRRRELMAHQNRGVETPAFRPGRKRRFTSP
jgi:hypothetical protein